MAESDLERRVARLERGVQLALGRARRVSAAIDRTTSAVNVRLPRLPPGSPGPGGGITTPCCGSLQLQATLKLQAPDGVIVPLSHSGGIWTGPRTFGGIGLWNGFRPDGFTVCSAPLGPATFTSSTLDFILRCGASNAFTLEGLGWIATQQTTFRTVPIFPVPGFCRGSHLSFFPVAGGAATCSPFNLAFRLSSNPFGYPVAADSLWVVYE